MNTRVRIALALGLAIVLLAMLLRPADLFEANREDHSAIQTPETPGVAATNPSAPAETPASAKTGARSDTLDRDEGYPDPSPVVTAAIAALDATDTPALVALYAPDEPAAQAAAEKLLERWLATDVVEYAFDSTTAERVRLGNREAAWIYVTATVHDSGIELQRTFVVPLELDGDRWYLSPVGENTPEVGLLGALDLGN